MKMLVAPLDWGLGHATRTIPVIRNFLRQGATVDLAVSGREAALYQSEFPELEQINISGYNIRYPERGFEMPFWLFKNYRHIRRVIRAEHQIAENLKRERGYDILFSDNRFGFWAAGAKNIYMTHQLRIAFPQAFSAFEKIGVEWHQSQMKKFDEIWVPDYAELPGLAGKLSHVEYADENFAKKIRYIGPQSRFSKETADKFTSENAQKKFRFLALLSGPEPMRTAFENALLRAFSKIAGQHAIIRGLPGEKNLPQTSSHITLFNHLETADFANAVKNAKWVISRPGYSTVMDMVNLSAKCIFVPTPGQTEQVYLGNSLQQAGFAKLLTQHEISAVSLLNTARKLETRKK